jgi:hypothetical protein
MCSVRGLSNRCIQVTATHAASTAATAVPWQLISCSNTPVYTAYVCLLGILCTVTQAKLHLQQAGICAVYMALDYKCLVCTP